FGLDGGQLASGFFVGGLDDHAAGHGTEQQHGGGCAHGDLQLLLALVRLQLGQAPFVFLLSSESFHARSVLGLLLSLGDFRLARRRGAGLCSAPSALCLTPTLFFFSDAAPFLFAFGASLGFEALACRCFSSCPLRFFLVDPPPFQVHEL